ncbi:hypothetical protein G7046_g878 [Stylonectria norvegica]|nr:hypothetical protein G7046_g878 [Stylonectria norvegica]
MSLRLAASCPRAVAREFVSSSRSFSTTPATLSDHVPPESPSYIRLPTPPQSEEKKLPRVRGVLPIPREVFPRAEGDRKVRPDYISQTVPKPAEARVPKNASQAWKLKMASTRRQNLEKGLKELWARRNRSDKIHDARVSAKFEEHNADARAPERADDRLTRSTVLDAILDTKVYHDSGRFARAQQALQNTLDRDARLREARQDALMELYINASNFIVNENELKSEIENVFAEDFFRKQGQAVGRYGNSENTWDVFGKPPTIANMLESTTGTSTKLMDIYESEYDRSVKRQKRIAEEFTGGKME